MLNDESILSIGACQIRDHITCLPRGFCHASHFSADRTDVTKKGTSAKIRNPFKYCDGAEGGI